MSAPTPGPPTLRGILLGSGPRMLRDAFGPVAAFYLGWRFSGLVLGIALATAVGLAAQVLAIRAERSGAMARLSLGFVVLHAVVGLVSRSEIVYLAQPILLSAGIGVAFLVSASIGRPLAGVFAAETYPFSAEMRASRTFRRVFGVESAAWGIFLIARSGARMLVLAHSSLEGYLAVNFLTGAPLMALMFTWSFWYGVRGFARSDEFGAAPAPAAA